MKKITRMIASEFVKSTFVVAIFVLFLQLMVMFLSELKYIGAHGYTFFAAIRVISAQSLVVIYDMLPMVCFIGALISLGKLSNTSELAIIRSSGYSQIRLSWVLSCCAFVIVTTLLVACQLVGYKMANQAQLEQQKYHGKALKLPKGLWTRVGDDFTGIGVVEGPNNLRQITVYKLFKTGGVKQLLTASEAIRIGDRWMGYHVKTLRQHGDHVLASYYDRKDLPIHFDYRHYFKPQSGLLPEYGLKQLAELIRFEASVGSDTSSYRYTFWSEIMTPFIVVVMTLLAMPFAMKNMRALSVSSQVFKGVLVGFGFYVLEIVIGRFSLYFSFNPVASAVLPTLFFLLFLIWMLCRRV